MYRLEVYVYEYVHIVGELIAFIAEARMGVVGDTKWTYTVSQAPKWIQIELLRAGKRELNCSVLGEGNLSSRHDTCLRHLSHGSLLSMSSPGLGIWTLDRRTLRMQMYII